MWASVTFRKKMHSPPGRDTAVKGIQLYLIALLISFSAAAFSLLARSLLGSSINIITNDLIWNAKASKRFILDNSFRS